MKNLDTMLKHVKYAELSRRTFLKGALAAGGALALAGCNNDAAVKTVTVTETKTVTVTEPTVPTEDAIEPIIKVPSYILADYASCVGCAICSIECSLKHYGIADMERTNIKVYGVNVNGGMVDIPILCMKCNDTPCMAVCPPKVNAISIHPTNGAILIDHDKCTVCGLCVEACAEQRTGCLSLSNDGNEVVGMCDLCDGNPACVTYCPENVLQLLAKVNPVINHARKPRSIAEDVYNFLYAVK